jgi:hypothetical protein
VTIVQAEDAVGRPWSRLNDMGTGRWCRLGHGKMQQPTRALFTYSNSP